ncbi:MAG TPA: hypothetical protein VGI95_19650 [Caulobacteraceae bacterium]|jgi:hypothetical protein
MMTIRRLHTYIGAFIAPSVLFFAFTGSLQLFSLHEAHGGYTPPAVIEELGSIHKDQVLKHPKPPGPPDADDAHAAHAGGHHGADSPPPWNVPALKCLFLAVATGLITSTLLGLWLALTTSRRSGLVIALIAAGAALPLLLVLA